MKRITLLILLFSIFLLPLSKTFIHIGFKINQKTISKELCVKKEIENNTCQGKCHLKKQLEKADKEEQKQAPTAQKEKYEVLYCNTAKTLYFLNYHTIHSDKNLLDYNKEFQTISYIEDIFRPPIENLI